MTELSEFEQIRNALGLTLEEIGALLGAKSHSTPHRWETSPNNRSSLKALEKAKALYKKRMKTDWVSTAPTGKPVTREEFTELYDATEDCVAVIRALLQSLPEGSRPLALPKRFR